MLDKWRNPTWKTTYNDIKIGIRMRKELSVIGESC